jgi:Spy/CpxP family protein refolding chaperone
MTASRHARPRPFALPAALVLVASLAACAAPHGGPPSASAAAPTPYAGQQTRDVKALSADEQADLLAGRGMGLAKAAELNGYPGPLHVLELARELELAPGQRARTEALFASMQREASALGARLVDEERALDALFASKQVDAARLADATQRIGALQAELRRVHLDAHLEQARILTAAQTARYVELRGYGAASAGGAHGGHRHRH